MTKNNQQTRKFLIGVAWPYANGALHLGHLAGSLLPATITNDYLRLRGEDVIMVSGSDMHGTPTAVKAWKENKDPADFARDQHEKHLEVMKKIGANYSLYTSTATANHTAVVQSLFAGLIECGYIFSETTEQFWSEKEHKFLLDRYIEGQCPNCDFQKARGDQCDNCGITLTPDELIYPYSIFGDQQLEKRKSKNYFLDLKSLQPKIEEYFGKASAQNWRNHVISTTQSWFKTGLEPRAITRDMEGFGVKLPVGHELLNSEGVQDDGKVIYVWFEAVSGYLSAALELSARESKLDDSLLNDFLPERGERIKTVDGHQNPVHSTQIKNQSLDWRDYWLSQKDDENSQFSYYFIGKDNIPFHTVIWPAILIGFNEYLQKKYGEDAPQLVLPTNVPANQYLNLKGAKFSKSTGNMITINEFWDTFGDTASRYFLISRMPENKDYSFNWEEFVEANNNELVANIGNFVNRTLVFWNKYFAKPEISEFEYDATVVSELDNEVSESCQSHLEHIAKHLEEFEYAKAIAELMNLGSYANKIFNDSEIWVSAKENPTQARRDMFKLLHCLLVIQVGAAPMLPEFSSQVANLLGLEPLKPAVGKDCWVVPALESSHIVSGNLEISGLKPLIKKLELEELGIESS